MNLLKANARLEQLAFIAIIVPVLLFAFACARRGHLSRNQALYLPMRDGVRIAVDLWLPEGLPSDTRIPAIMRATRYWRSVEVVGGSLTDDPNYQEAGRFNSRGYALIVVDARGSGASFGTRPYELNEEEVRDYGEVVDWIIRQPWSNGRVGAYGVSYSGNTAEMLSVNRHPAVKAIAPLFNDFDNFGHLVFPGGILCIGFLKDWSARIRNLDLNDICAARNLEGSACRTPEESTRREARRCRPRRFPARPGGARASRQHTRL